MPRGLVKAKKYDWKDSNLALFGSDTEKSVKKESAEQEPAWAGAGSEEGLKIWRIENFEVKDWSEEDYGEFYNGDSYIILNTYKDEETEELNYDVHFWIGKNSSQDEYGTAAYKTVELDTLLDDKPVQHRECQGHESSLFKSYFKKGLVMMEGGATSGFRQVPPEEYISRLLRFRRDKDKCTRVKEFPSRARSYVTSDDVYILDKGKMFYQWNGSQSSPFEKNEASQWVQGVIAKRAQDIDVEVLDEDAISDSHDFYSCLDEDPVEEDDSDDEDADDDQKLMRVDVESRNYETVKEGGVSLEDFQSDDVFIFDTGKTVFVWVGANADPKEKRNGLPLAHNYLQTSGSPWRPISVIKEGGKNREFTAALSG